MLAGENISMLSGFSDRATRLLVELRDRAVAAGAITRSASKSQAQVGHGRRIDAGRLSLLTGEPDADGASPAPTIGRPSPDRTGSASIERGAQLTVYQLGVAGPG